jgi:hypothetical protein
LVNDIFTVKKMTIDTPFEDLHDSYSYEEISDKSK